VSRSTEPRVLEPRVLEPRFTELCTLGDLLVRGCERHPDRDVLVLPGVRRSYRELTDRAQAVARSLMAAGVTRGDRVGLFMPNGADFIEILFGISFTGAIAVPVNARFTARELSHVLQDAGLAVLFAADAPGEPRSRADVIAEALGPFGSGGRLGATGRPRLNAAAAPELAVVVAAGQTLRPGAGMMAGAEFAEFAALVPARDAEAARRRVALRDPAIMFYTSGTTARPKGCVLSHEAQVRTGVSTAVRLGFADGERMFAPCPMFHTASSQPLVATLQVGGTFVTMAHFEPADALALIEAERVTAMFPAFPPLTLGLLNCPDYSPDSFARVRTVFTVAPPEALKAMQRRMPHSIMVNAYGMTEFGGSVVMVDPADDDEARLATQGPPFPGIEIGIRDESGRPLGPGERGEIVVRGPASFDRYHNDPVKTAEAIDPGGWYHSGDLGEIGADGRLRFLGRLKDMLKVGGENVAAIEIASHLQAHPAVSVAQVVGIADEKYGEVPAAFIELSPGATLSEDEVLAHCQAGLARFKVPRYVRFVTEWPMSSTKVQTFRLREQLEAELEVARDSAGGT
jgi:fatty-acyl-CoA synthase